jgi:ABC-type bacteriocin/lantibiotic exporter with double-glycine peptidase domain
MDDQTKINMLKEKISTEKEEFQQKYDNLMNKIKEKDPSYEYQEKVPQKSFFEKYYIRPYHVLVVLMLLSLPLLFLSILSPPTFFMMIIVCYVIAGSIGVS